MDFGLKENAYRYLPPTLRKKLALLWFERKQGEEFDFGIRE